MPTSVKQMMEEANAAVPKITAAQAHEMIAKGNTLVIDVREALELETSGKAAGATHHSRGMLEFRADPEYALSRQEFLEGKKRHPVLRVRRACGAGRQGAQGYGLWPGLQYGRLQGLGRERRRGGKAGGQGQLSGRMSGF